MSHSLCSAAPPDLHSLRSPGEWSLGAYELPPLPYAYDAMEGFLSAEMLEIHHGRHRRKYVDGTEARTLRSLRA